MAVKASSSFGVPCDGLTSSKLIAPSYGEAGKRVLITDH